MKQIQLIKPGGLENISVCDADVLCQNLMKFLLK